MMAWSITETLSLVNHDQLIKPSKRLPVTLRFVKLLEWKGRGGEVKIVTRSRMAPKLGTVSAMKRRQRTERERKAHLFQLKPWRRVLTRWIKCLCPTGGDPEDLLEELRRGVGDDGEGSDEVEQEHHLGMWHSMVAGADSY